MKCKVSEIYCNILYNANPIKICTLHIANSTVNIIVYYLFFCTYIVLTANMCLNNCLLQADEKAYKNLLDSLNSEITNATESCEYLESDCDWPIQPDDLLIMQLNVRGLSSKIDQIKKLLDNNPCGKAPEVILLCET